MSINQQNRGQRGKIPSRCPNNVPQTLPRKTISRVKCHFVSIQSLASLLRRSTKMLIHTSLRGMDFGPQEIQLSSRMPYSYDGHGFCSVQIRLDVTAKNSILQFLYILCTYGAPTNVVSECLRLF